MQTYLFSQEKSQLPAYLLLAKHKARVSQLETEIEQQKHAVKTTNHFSTGIQMVSGTLFLCFTFSEQHFR